MSTYPTSNIILHTQAWIKTFVVDLHLCPFSTRPFHEDRIKYVATLTSNIEELIQTVIEEGIALIKSAPKEVETTLIIHPSLLVDFNEFLQFIDIMEQYLPEMGWEGILQLAHFHPDYHFEYTSPTALSNYTNRSPYPTLHLLREESVTRAVESYPDVSLIPERNVAKMEALGIEKIEALGSQWTNFTSDNSK